MNRVAHRDPVPRRMSAGLAGGGSNATIGRRVARILALPAAVVLVLLAVLAGEQVQGYRNSRDLARSVDLTLSLQALIHELQNERGVSAGVLGGNPSFKVELEPARKSVDQQRAALAAKVEGGGEAEAKVRDALQQLGSLSAMRQLTDNLSDNSSGRSEMFNFFTDRINQLNTVDVGLDAASDDELRRGTNVLQALTDLSEATAQERAFLNGVFAVTQFKGDEFVRFAAMRTAKDAALARFKRFATPEENASLDYVQNTGASQTTKYFEDKALKGAGGQVIQVNPQSWWSGMTTVLDDLRQLQEHVGSEIQIRAADLQNGAGLRILGLVALVLVCFGGSIVLATLASLSITRPLASLAEEADAVASDRLPSAVQRIQAGAPDDERRAPDPVAVPVRATREITSVASALNRMQSAAYDLATEQAAQRQRTIASLANLGRRNQNLIRRQLGFITRLEREEMDPTALGNLFELDHLATRMRRNAASLLVLVGEAAPQRLSRPVAIADVIRAAVSEVEEYRRVALRRVDDVTLVGSSVASVAHLLSELIENGLTFSPPDTDVEIQGRAVGDRYLIAITDQGIGMAHDELDLANARLRGEGDFIAAPTRFLGHFVVGQLARDHGIEIELVPSPVVGITARVLLPPSVLSGGVAVGAGGSPALEAEPVPSSLGGSGSIAVVESPPRLTARPLALAHVAGPEQDESYRESADTPAPGVPLPTVAQFGRPQQAQPEPQGEESAPWGSWNGGQDESAWDNWSGETSGNQPESASYDPAASYRSEEQDSYQQPFYEPAQPAGAQYGNAEQFGQYAEGQYPGEQYGNGQYGNGQYGDPQHGNGQYGNGQYSDPQYGNGNGNGQYVDQDNGQYGNDRPEAAPFDATSTGSFPIRPTPPRSAARPAGSGAIPVPTSPAPRGTWSRENGTDDGSSAASGGSSRTKNGLRKRTPRGDRAAEPAAARRVVAAEPAEAVPDAPDDVRNRLTSLRAGLARGQNSPVSHRGTPPR